jgi:hypothetical protein
MKNRRYEAFYEHAWLQKVRKPSDQPGVVSFCTVSVLLVVLAVKRRVAYVLCKHDELWKVLILVNDEPKRGCSGVHGSPGVWLAVEGARLR